MARSTLNADGSFTYTPASGFSGADSFTYIANDGSADSNVATVSFHRTRIKPPPWPTTMRSQLTKISGSYELPRVSLTTTPTATAMP